MTTGGVAGRCGAALVAGLLVATSSAAVGQPTSTGSSARSSSDSRSAAPVERTVRYVLVQRSRVRLDIRASAQVRRVRVASALPRHMALRKGVLSGWVPRGRAVVRLRGISTAYGERGRRLRLKVVVLGRPQVARAGTSLLTRSPSGQPGNGFSRSPVVSADGSTVAFLSEATNLVSPRLSPSPSGPRAFAWDRLTGRTEVVSVAPDGTPISGYDVSLSADGSRALFLSGKVLHLRDRRTSTTRTLATEVSHAVISADGTTVTYSSGDSTLRLDLPSGVVTDLGVGPFMAASPDARHLAVREADRFLIWDTQTRTVVRERPLVVAEYCRWWMTKLTDDTLRGVVAGGCDHTSYWSLIDAVTHVTLAHGAGADANETASWVATVSGRGRVQAGPVGETPQLVSSQPARNFSTAFTARATPSVAIAGEGDVVAWSVNGANVVRNAVSDQHQIYIWTSGR